MAYDRPKFDIKEQPKSKGWLLDQLSTAGGIGGSLGGAALGTAILPGIGTLIGGALGGTLGSGAGEAGENLITGDELGRNVGKEALMGGITGVPIFRAGKGIIGASKALVTGAGKTAANQALQSALKVGTGAVAKGATKSGSGIAVKAGKALEKAGGKTLGTQSLMTGAQARAKGVNPMKAFTNINKRTGLTNLDDMAEVSKGLTGGKDSMLDMLTREAVGSTNGVKLPNLKNVAEMALDDSGSLLSTKQRQEFIQKVTKAGSTMYGGSKGSLSTLANPQIALDQANIFRQNARQLASGFNTTAVDKQLSKVYNSVAKTIEDSIYSSPGVGASLPTLIKAGSDDLLFKAQSLKAAGNNAQAKAYEKVAQDLRKVTDIKGLRSFKKDFVDIGIIDTATAQAEGARGLSTGALSGRFEPVKLLSSMAAPRVGGGLINAGQALQSGATGGLVGAIPQIPQGLIGATARQTGGRALTGMSQGVEEPTNTPYTPSADISLFRQQAFGEQPIEQMGGQIGQIPQSNPFGVSSEQIGQALMMALMAGDNASAGQLKQMLEVSQMFGGGQEQKEYSSVIAGNISDFNSSLSELGQLEKMISSGAGTTDPILGRLRSINPYDTEQQTLQAAIDKTRQLVGKALEGGVLRKEDEEKYKKILPTTADSRQVAINKISMIRSQLKAKLQDYSSMVGAGGGSLEDILMQRSN